MSPEYRFVTNASVSLVSSSPSSKGVSSQLAISNAALICVVITGEYPGEGSG